jgi:hypothetical protein
MIRIQRDGYEPYEKTQFIEAGRTTQLKIQLEAARLPTPAASVSRMARSIELPSSDEPGASSTAAGLPPPGLVSAPEPASAGRTLALATTGGLALISTGVWVGFAIRGASLENQADDLRRQVNAEHPATGCSRGEPPCDELRVVSDRRATANTIAIVGGVSTGVSAAAFAATLFLWPRSPRSVALVLPTLSRECAGIDVRGSF